LRAAAAPRSQRSPNVGRHRLPRSLEGCQPATSPAAVLGYLTRSAALPLDLDASLAERLFFGVAKPSRPARDRAIFLLGQAISRYFPDLSWLAARTTRPWRCNRLSRSSCSPPWLRCPHLSSSLPMNSTCSGVCKTGIIRWHNRRLRGPRDKSSEIPKENAVEASVDFVECNLNRLSCFSNFL